MLLSAGMGIGLLFWSVGEPISHLLTPSPMFGNIDPASPRAVQAAMATTFFHWGIHPVFVNIVVSKSYKIYDDISSMNSIDSSFSGFSQTLSSRFQLRMFRDHLLGFFSFAASYTAFRFANTASPSPLCLCSGVRKLSPL